MLDRDLNKVREGAIRLKKQLAPRLEAPVAQLIGYYNCEEASGETGRRRSGRGRHGIDHTGPCRCWQDSLDLV